MHRLLLPWLIVCSTLMVSCYASEVTHRERPIPVHKPDNLSITAFTHYLLDETYYDKHFRAIPFDGGPTNAYVAIHVNSFGPIDVLRMDYSIEIILHVRWIDRRLRFTNYAEPIVLSPLMHSVWLPDVFFKNAKNIERHSLPSSNYLLWLWPNGTLLFSQKLSLVLRCHMDLKDFPFDIQTCSITVSSFGMNDHHMRLHWLLDLQQSEGYPIIFSDEISLNEFYKPGVNYSVSTYYSVVTQKNFSVVQADFKLRRKQSYYLFNSYLPSVFIVLITWSSFAIDFKSAPARVSLSTLSLLALLTQTVALERKLPPVSYITALGIWHIGCLLFIHLSLLEYMFVNLLTRRYQKKSTNSTNNKSQSTANCTHSEHGSLLPMPDNSTPNITSSNNRPSCWSRLCCCLSNFSLTPQRLDNIFLALYPVVFILFNLFYWFVLVPPQAFYQGTSADD